MWSPRGDTTAARIPPVLFSFHHCKPSGLSKALAPFGSGSLQKLCQAQSAQGHSFMHSFLTFLSLHLFNPSIEYDLIQSLIHRFTYEWVTQNLTLEHCGLNYGCFLPKKKCCATYPNAKQQRCCGVLKCAVILRNGDPGWPQAHLLARRFLEMTPPWSTCESASLIII